MDILKLHNFIVVAGIWMLGNGVLHDVFVLREGKPFDRDLIRLLIDGHILIFSGVIYLLCYRGVKDHSSLAFFVSMAIAVFLLGYCALIFKMLPSIGTILINGIALAWLIISYVNLPSTNNAMANNHSPIVRISIGHFQPAQLEAVTNKLTESEIKLRPAIEKLHGNLGYYVAIDKEKHSMTNVSLWETLQDAQQMSTLKQMLDLRKEFEALGIEFIPITNHETLWRIE